MEEVIHNLSISMLKEGCEPYVFAPYVRGKDNRLDVPYKVLRYSRPSSKRFGLRQLLIPLLWYHFKYRFDILHCHGVYPPGYVGSSFHKITGVPLIITPHGGDIKENDKGIIINSRITARIKKTFSSAQAVTAISSDIKARILKLGVNSDKVHLIPNGVFLNEYISPEEYHQQTNDSYILYLGSLIKRKGVDILMQAFHKICKDYPNVRLKIAGTGKEENNLITLSKELRIDQNVDFVGLVRGDRKRELLRNALFLVCPSRYEPFGIVILEAFASGIPVIASRIGGIPDIVKDGENGFLFEPENTEELTEKMEIMLNNNVLRNTMAQNTLQCANRYNWHSIVNEYINIYSKIL
jgi:glycosyltransferase involved in cell wall biosynthesis